MRQTANYRKRRKRVIFSLLTSGLLALLVSLCAFLLSTVLWPVQEVEVKGNRMYPAKNIQNEISRYSTLLTVNPQKIERKVEVNIWVKDASVQREWRSDTVTVEVEERRAVMLAETEGKRVFFSADGEKLPGSGGRNLSPVNVEKGALGGVFSGLKDLERGGVSPESVEKVGPGGVRVNVSYSGTEGKVVFSRGEIGEGQMRVLKGLMRRYPEAGAFDLRSPERVVVD